MAELSPLLELESAVLNQLIQLDRLVQLGQSTEAYELDVYMKSRSLSELVAELEHVVQAVARARTFTDTRLLLKFYTITWVSLSDVLGSLFCVVLELGYAAQDISFK